MTYKAYITAFFSWWASQFPGMPAPQETDPSTDPMFPQFLAANYPGVTVAQVQALPDSPTSIASANAATAAAAAAALATLPSYPAGTLPPTSTSTFPTPAPAPVAQASGGWIMALGAAFLFFSMKKKRR